MSYGGKRCMAAVAVVTVMLVTMASAVFPDASSAYSAEEGSSAMYFETDGTLSSSDIDRLYNPDDFTYEVETLLGIAGGVSAAETSGLSVRIGTGEKVDDDTYTTFYSRTLELDFAYTVTDTGTIFSEVGKWNADLLRSFNDNTLESGDVLKVSGHLRVVYAVGSVLEYATNGNGDFVLTRSTQTTATDVEIESGEMEFTHGGSTVNVDADMHRSVISRIAEEHDFGDTDPEDATEDTMVLMHRSYEDSYSLKDYDISGDVNCSFRETLYADDFNDRYKDSLYDVFSNAIVLSSDIIYRQACCYGIFNSLFTTVNDPTLSDNDALKEYLSSIGTVSDDYSDASDLYDSAVTPPAHSSVRRLMVIGSIGVLLSVAALAILFYLSRRK